MPNHWKHAKTKKKPRQQLIAQDLSLRMIEQKKKKESEQSKGRKLVKTLQKVSVHKFDIYKSIPKEEGLVSVKKKKGNKKNKKQGKLFSLTQNSSKITFAPETVSLPLEHRVIVHLNHSLAQTRWKKIPVSKRKRPQKKCICS